MAAIIAPSLSAQTRIEGNEIIFEFNANEAVNFIAVNRALMGYEKSTANQSEVVILFSPDYSIKASERFKKEITDASRIKTVEVYGRSVVAGAIDEKFISWEKGFKLKETEPGSGIWQLRVKLPAKYPAGTDLHLNYLINGKIWTVDPRLNIDPAWANSVLPLPHRS